MKFLWNNSLWDTVSIGLFYIEMVGGCTCGMAAISLVPDSVRKEEGLENIV